MKKTAFAFFLPAVLLLHGCKTPDNKLTGKWVMVLPAHKTAMLEKIYSENLQEIEKISELPEEAKAYNIHSLDSFKQIAKQELKTQYDMVLERNKIIQYDFTKDGHILLTNLKQNKTDTVYNYTLAEKLLTLVPHKNKALESETTFYDTTKLQIFKVDADSLILTKSADNITDTFIYISQNQNKK